MAHSVVTYSYELTRSQCIGLKQLLELSLMSVMQFTDRRRCLKVVSGSFPHFPFFPRSDPAICRKTASPYNDMTVARVLGEAT